MRSSGFAWGAITVVNALASGKGAALSIDLKVEVDTEVTPDSSAVEVENIGFPADDVGLVRAVTRGAFERLGLEGYGAKLVVDSSIPVGRGLKSSSAVSNAVAVSLLSALQKSLEDMETVRLGVEASLQAGVSVTGALDDALASYLGGFVVTDNLAMKMIRREEVESKLRVVLRVPRSVQYTRDVDMERLRKLARLVDEVHRLAVDGEIWSSLTLNGLVYAPALGLDSRPIFDAIDAGALAAGVTGSGPALAAVCEPKVVEEVRSVWETSEGETWVVSVNNSRCGVSRNE
ncbi:MAG: shikimate kinase [Candidatus Geothermarchaeales archaeon]